jgi:hypothetical protein
MYNTARWKREKNITFGLSGSKDSNDFLVVLSDGIVERRVSVLVYDLSP